MFSALAQSFCRSGAGCPEKQAEKNRMLPCGSESRCFPAQAVALRFGLPNLRQSMTLPTSATPKMSVPMPG